MSLRRAIRASLLALLVLTVVPAVLFAHGALKSSSPARGAVLARTPAALYLTFTEQVELAVARVVLVRNANDTIQLSPLRADSGGRTLVADLSDPRVANLSGDSVTYTIHWLITGKDGYPVRGSIPFTVLADGLVANDPAAGNAGLRADTLRDTANVHAHDSTSSPAAIGDSTSGTVAGGIFASNGAVQTFTRWVGFAAFFTAIGAVCSLVAVAPALARQGRSSFAQSLARRCNFAGLFAAGVLLIVEVCRLVLQHHALSSESISLSYASILGSTTWGTAWMVRALSLVMLLFALLLARRSVGALRRVGLVTSVVAMAGIATGMSLSGHAAAVQSRTTAILYDAAHVLSAGAWIGTLALVLLVTLPLLRSDAATALIAVRSFSVVAMGAVALMLASGVLSALNHVGTFDALWNSNYGKVLLFKVAIALVVMLLGARNQLRLRNDRVSGTDRVNSIARVGRIELLAALGVLLLTAILVATPTPTSALH